jgi:transposase
VIVAGSEIPLVQDEHGRPATLPDDPRLLRELVETLLRQLSEAQGKALKLQHELEVLKRGLWGRKSEKVNASQLLMFAELLDAHGISMPTAASEEAKPAAELEPEPKRNGKKKSGGRSLIPKDLPRQIITHRVSGDARKCVRCGKPRKTIGYESSEQLEIVPAHVVVHEHRCEKIFCETCEGEFETAQKPSSPIEKGAAGPGLLAHLVVSKVDDHLPVYRQCEILRRHGVEIPAATVGRWILMVAEALRPLHRLMKERVKQSKVIQTDETKVPVQQPGGGETHKGRMWVFLGDERHPYIVYHYTRTKESEGPKAWLRGFRGDLQADAYVGFDQLYVEDPQTGTKMREGGCNAHARRKFESIKMNFPAEALTALDVYRRLYAIEGPATRMSKQRRRKLRRKEARPIQAKYEEWLKEVAAKELPNSELGKAVRYVQNNWIALTRYVNEPRLSIDNNAAERALRGVAIGRKNWLFAGHDQGAEALAVLFSMIESAKRAKVNPETWLRDVLSRMADLPMNTLEDLLPDRWKQRQVPSARYAMDQARLPSMPSERKAVYRLLSIARA